MMRKQIVRKFSYDSIFTKTSDSKHINSVDQLNWDVMRKASPKKYILNFI